MKKTKEGPVDLAWIRREALAEETAIAKAKKRRDTMVRMFDAALEVTKGEKAKRAKVPAASKRKKG
jgi:hypothetical protein